MSLLPLNLARVSTLMRSDMVSSQVSRGQAAMLEVQNQLSTGKKLNRASDDPAAAAAAKQMIKTLDDRKAFASNISAATDQLSAADSTLGDLTDLLRQAQTIASANLGSDVTPEAREGAAAVVQSLYDQAVTLGNKSLNGTFLFGGDKATAAPFRESDNGGITFVGSSTSLANQVDENSAVPFMVDGAEAFGAVSSRVGGSTNLTPALTAGTRLADVGGAAGKGVRPGSIVVSNGTVTKTIDLSKADTAGDVATAINDAAVGGITAAVGTAGNLVLSAGGTDDVTVAEVAGGTTAGDLGILKTTGGGAGVAVTGASLNPAVTDLTPLSALKGGAGIDVTSGMKVTNGSKTTTLTFDSPPLRAGATVGDLLNQINGSGTGVLARINAAGTGIDLVNPTQGVVMTVSENGGTTAADLGVRSFAGDTKLADLNGGTGVRTVDGDDLKLTRSDGTTFDVDLAGATTVQDVLDKINAADTTNGTNPPKLKAALAATGNGIVLTDTAGGPGAPAAAAMNFSDALKDLGLDATAVGTTVTGKDVSAVPAQGVFANLAKLRDSLKNNDQAGITTAGENLDADTARVARVRGQTGARVQELEARKDRLDDQNVATQALLSEVEDTDFPSAIAKFQTLQTALQATMQAGGKIMNQSLMDFLG